MTDFLHTLNYSSVNEDWRTEAEALALAPGHHVLCVTGSGARVLDLLAAERLSIVAIDMVPAQNQLLRLKMAAIRTLGGDALLGFLGVSPQAPTERLAHLDALDLTPACRAFWQARRKSVAAGIVYQGRFERHLARLSRVIRALRGRAVRTLMSFDDLEAQRRFVDRRWDVRWWEAVYRMALHPRVSRRALGDPAFYPRASVPVGATLYRRMNRLLHHTLARDSFMVGLVLTGRLPEADRPPHLTAEGAATIRDRLDGIEIIDADLIHFLETGTERFDRFSLSDVPSYLDEAGLLHLLRLVSDHAAPGARMVLRQFLTRYPMPEEVAPLFRRDRVLEERMAHLDHAFAYEYLIAEVSRARNL